MAKSNKQINKEDNMADNSPDSPAVIAYRLGQVETAVKEGFNSHNEKLDNIVSNFSTKGEVQAIDIRVQSLESDRVWLVRLVVGAVVFALLALVGVGFKTFN
jgi:hypothetical protein